MRSVPAGALIAVRIVTSGRLLVALVGAKQLKEPRASSKPVFRGAVQDKLSFRVVIPEADDYVLVLSNRAGKETLKVEAEIRALRGRPKPKPKPPPGSSETRAALDPGRDAVAGIGER